METMLCLLCGLRLNVLEIMKHFTAVIMNKLIHQMNMIDKKYIKKLKKPPNSIPFNYLGVTQKNKNCNSSLISQSYMEYGLGNQDLQAISDISITAI